MNNPRCDHGPLKSGDLCPEAIRLLAGNERIVRWLKVKGISLPSPEFLKRVFPTTVAERLLEK